MTVSQLQEEAKKLGVKGGLSKLNKNQLIEKISSMNTSSTPTPYVEEINTNTNTPLSKEDRREKMKEFFERSKLMNQRVHQVIDLVQNWKNENESELVEQMLDEILDLLSF